MTDKSKSGYSRTTKIVVAALGTLILFSVCCSIIVGLSSLREDDNRGITQLSESISDGENQEPDIISGDSTESIVGIPSKTLEPTETPSPTNTTEPTETPPPTNTPEPTNTPIATETLIPTDTPNATAAIAALAVDFLSEAELILLGTMVPALENFSILFSVAADEPTLVYDDTWNDLVTELVVDLYDGCAFFEESLVPSLLQPALDEVLLACEQFELAGASITLFQMSDNKFGDEAIQYLLDGTTYFNDATENISKATDILLALSETLGIND